MDALSAIVSLLRPQAIGAKIIHGAGRWAVRYPKFAQPSFALVLKGPCWLAADGFAATTLETGDFVLFPAMPAFTLASDPRTKPKLIKPNSSADNTEELFHGDARQKPAVTLLGGYFAFDPINAAMLLELLPKILHIHACGPAKGGVAPIVELIQREAREKRSGRALVLPRLIEVLLVEALRSVQSDLKTTGLLAGLRDQKLALALHAIHTRTAHPWSLAMLAREAGMSRSSFAERFAKVIRMTPLNYLLHWRIAVAKNLLAREEKSVAEVAFAVGYESASGFSTAFTRETGQPPKAFIGIARG